MINEYSKAIFEIALEDNQLDFCLESFDCLMKVIKDNPDFLNILKSPKIKNSDKKKIIDNSFNSCYKNFVNFIKIVIDNQRIGEIDNIYKDFILEIKEYKKIKLVDVYSVKELNKEEIKKITKVLGDIYYGYTIEINNIISSNVIGGYHIIVNGKSLDLSIKNQLDCLKNSI